MKFTISLLFLCFTLSACSFHHKYPTPIGYLKLHAVETYFNDIYTYSQYSTGRVELKPYEITEVEKGFLSCTYSIDEIKITIYKSSNLECISVKNYQGESLTTQEEISVNFFLINKVDFLYRDKIKNSKLNFISPSSIYLESTKNNMDIMHLDILLTALHEVYHYMVEKKGITLPPLTEEFLANVFSYSILKKVTDSPSLLEHLSKMTSDPSNEELSQEINASFRGELMFLTNKDDVGNENFKTSLYFINH